MNFGKVCVKSVNFLQKRAIMASSVTIGDVTSRRDVDSKSMRERVDIMTSIGSNDITIKGFYFFPNS